MNRMDETLTNIHAKIQYPLDDLLEDVTIIQTYIYSYIFMETLILFRSTKDEMVKIEALKLMTNLRDRL